MEGKFLVWNMELLKYGMEWKKFSILLYIFHTYSCKCFFILSAVNNIAFGHTHKMIKEKSSNQRSIRMTAGKKNGNYNQIRDISILAI